MKWPLIRRSKVEHLQTDSDTMENLMIELATDDGIFIGPMSVWQLYYIIKYGHAGDMIERTHMAKDGNLIFRAWDKRVEQ